MNAHKTQAMVLPNGKLEISNLPFLAGSMVEIIVLGSEETLQPSFPLRGTFGAIHEPFEPAVSLDEWDALK